MEHPFPLPHHRRMAHKSVKNADRRKTFIKAWRKHRGKTQSQIADFIGISVPQLSRIESGEQEYRQDLLEMLADALQCGPADLLMRDPSQPDGLWTIWDTLKPVQREQVVEIAKTLKRTGTE
jgi:transcriptional regulator with XRE-family HTH domain